MTRAASTSPRRRMSAEQRRADIVARAIAVFARHGLSGTTTAQLAAACGVSEALLFRLFGDKRGIYAAIIQRVVEDGKGAFPEEAARRKDDLGVFQSVAETILRRTNDDPDFLRLLLNSALEGHEFVQMFHQARTLEVVGFLTRYLRVRMRDGAFRREDPELLALGFLGMCKQLALARHIYRLPRVKDRPPARAAAAYAQLFVEGLRAPAGRPSLSRRK